MGFFSYLFYGGLAAYGIHKVKQWNEEEISHIQSKIQEEIKRKSCVYIFDQGLNEDEFRAIVYSCAKKIKRIKKVEIDGLAISCLAVSQSGITQWRFTLDFNDYGKLTGKCYSSSENSDSNIPERLNDLIYVKLEPFIEKFEPIEKTEEITAPSKSKKKKRKKRSKKWIFVLLIFFVISVLSLIGYYEYQKLIPIGYGYDDFNGITYTEAIQKLKESGFTNVHPKEISDLTLSREDEEDLVTNIEFLFIDKFNKNTQYPSNMWINVVYHTVELYKMPITSKDAKGMNYIEVIEKLESAGYTNIKTNIEYDIITGWLTDDGEVKSVTVDGTDEYEYYDEFRLDAEIVVTYHTLKSNKP